MTGLRVRGTQWVVLSAASEHSWCGASHAGPRRCVLARTRAIQPLAMVLSQPLFTFVIARVLRRFPAYTGRHMARLAARFTVDDVPTFRTTAYRYTSRAQSATREPM